MDEARQVTSCAELHDEVDVVTVPLWLEAKRQLEGSVSSPVSFASGRTTGSHLEVFQLDDVRVSNALEDFNLCQEVFHRCLVQALLGHTFYGYHLSSVLLWRQDMSGLYLERARAHAWPERLIPSNLLPITGLTHSHHIQPSPSQANGNPPSLVFLNPLFP